MMTFACAIISLLSLENLRSMKSSFGIFLLGTYGEDLKNSPAYLLLSGPQIQ